MSDEPPSTRDSSLPEAVEDDSRVELARYRSDLAQLRSHLANERTHLGYVRTGISLIGFGITLDRFNLYLLQIGGARPGSGVHRTHTVGLGMALLGLALLAWSLARYQHVARDIERGVYQARFKPVAFATWVLIVCGGVASFWLLSR